MNRNFEENIDYVISREVLLKNGTFTLEDIFESVKSKIHSMFDNFDSIKTLIREKVRLLCDTGLVTYTGLVYYVN